MLHVVEETEAPDLSGLYREVEANMAQAPQEIRKVPEVRREAPSREALMAIQYVASLLTVRLALVLAVIGAFALGCMATLTGSQTGLYVLVAFLPVVITVAWLAQRRVQ